MVALAMAMAMATLLLLFIPIQPSNLDPKQLTALQSMGIPTTIDPCSIHRNSTTVCDSATPFRHLLSLTLTDCSPDLDISSTALRALSTVTSLSFSDCPNIPQLKRPLSSLLSFSCVHSLKRLSGVWLSRLGNLTELTLVSVPVSASAPFVFLSQMPHLLSATVTDANLTGQIPHHWHSLNLTHLDLSSNNLKGILPSSINALGSLQFLNLSSNSLSGNIPDSIGELTDLQNVSLSRNSISGSIPEAMSALPKLAHLDLSSNRLNGSIPKFLAEMSGLKYLNLEDNDLSGVVPFNASFIKRLEVFKIGGNSNLCYKKGSVTSKAAKLGLGIAACDRYGMPVSPPPDKSSSGSGDYSDNGDRDESDDGGGGSGKSGGGRHGPSVLVLGVAIGLSCLVFLIIFFFCLSKVCG